MLRYSGRGVLRASRPWREGAPDYVRANARRAVLERKRIEASRYTPPVEPTAEQACTLYRQLLRAGERRLVITDKAYYRRKLRHEFEVTARQTSARVRGIMYEKGQWMLHNDLGGVV